MSAETGKDSSGYDFASGYCQEIVKEEADRFYMS